MAYDDRDYNNKQPPELISSYSSKSNQHHERSYSYTNSYSPNATALTSVQFHQNQSSKSYFKPDSDPNAYSNSTPPSSSLARSKTLQSSSSKRLIEKPVKSIFRLIPSSWACRVFLLITLLEAGANISIVGVLYSRYRLQSNVEGDVAKSRALPVFLGIFGLAHGYQFVLAVDACYNRNMILILGLLVFNACL